MATKQDFYAMLGVPRDAKADDLAKGERISVWYVAKPEDADASAKANYVMIFRPGQPRPK